MEYKHPASCNHTWSDRSAAWPAAAQPFCLHCGLNYAQYELLLERKKKEQLRLLEERKRKR